MMLRTMTMALAVTATLAGLTTEADARWFRGGWGHYGYRGGWGRGGWGRGWGWGGYGLGLASGWGLGYYGSAYPYDTGYDYPSYGYYGYGGPTYVGGYCP